MKDKVTYIDSGTVTFFNSKFLINLSNREAGLQLTLSDTQYECHLRSQIFKKNISQMVLHVIEND